MNKTLIGLLTCVWLMEPSAAQAVLRDIIERKEIPSVDPHPATAVGYNMAIQPQGASRVVTGYALGMAGYDPTSMATVSVVNIEDTLSPWYADWKADQLRAAFADESVLGVVIRMNCIGGADQAAYLLTDVLAEKNKPVVVHCAYGNMNSSAYWTACGADYIMSYRSTDRIGGIGIYIPFLDQTGYFEKMGYTMKDIYAPESTEKNAEFRAAQKGDFKPYEAYASEVRATFVSYVKEKRAGKLNLKAGDPFAGGTYNATDALAIGLIDEIGSFDRAVEKCVELALLEPDSNPQASAPKITPQASAPVITPQATTPPTTMFGYLKLDALASLKGLAADAITPDQIAAVNAELKGAGFGLALISETEFKAGVEASGQVTALTTQLTTAQGALKTAQEEVARLGKQPGAEPTEPKNAADPAPVATAQPTGAAIIAELPHNKELDKNPMFNF